ncbi:MAG: DUF3795 domain-containing protein [Gammaproteobacteria bacterium]|nr:DUF3795 domain-containing protein [Gammaproteobacteria bacterium]
MKEIIVDDKLIAMCGLYCGACKRYLKGACPGCRENLKATWCKVRTCCLENSFSCCADCQKFADYNQCKKLNNFISKIFAFIFGSDRIGSILRIKKIGKTGYAEERCREKSMSIKRK